MIVWVEAEFGWTDLGKLLAEPALPFLVSYGLVYLVTAFGLSLLILLLSPLLTRQVSRGAAIPMFIMAGGVLGGALFAWTSLFLFFASCGALSAAMAALLMPELFSSAPDQLTEDALAD
jgi:hypothetical protein